MNKGREHIQTTIRIPYKVWTGLRRLQEQQIIKSINHEANKHFAEITEALNEQKEG